MRQVIVFPDVEGLLVSYLTQQLVWRADTASVHVSVPNPRPARFVLVPRIGGTEENLVTDAATIGVECWAATPQQAAKLAQLVRALIHALPGKVVEGVPFYRVQEFAGPANLPDPTSDQSRYVFTLSVTARGFAA